MAEGQFTGDGEHPGVVGVQGVGPDTPELATLEARLSPETAKESIPSAAALMELMVKERNQRQERKINEKVIEIQGIFSAELQTILSGTKDMSQYVSDEGGKLALRIAKDFTIPNQFSSNILDGVKDLFEEKGYIVECQQTPRMDGEEAASDGSLNWTIILSVIEEDVPTTSADIPSTGLDFRGS